MDANKSFLGTGWSFPPTFDKSLAVVDMTSGVEDIERSLEIIFSTVLGERVMNPTFGCSLREMMFETMNTARLAYIQNLIRTAILYHEPRIDADVIDIDFGAEQGRLMIAITYTVRGTNSRFNYVYPFYLNGES